MTDPTELIERSETGDERAAPRLSFLLRFEHRPFGAAAIVLHRWRKRAGALALKVRHRQALDMPASSVEGAKRNVEIGAVVLLRLYQPLTFNELSVELAVVGVYLQGQPLNWRLTERSARNAFTNNP